MYTGWCCGSSEGSCAANAPVSARVVWSSRWCTSRSTRNKELWYSTGIDVADRDLSLCELVRSAVQAVWLASNGGRIARALEWG